MTEKSNKDDQTVDGTTNPGGSQYPGKADVDFLKWVMGVIIVVLLIAAGGAVMSVMSQYQSSYTDLRDEVKAQNDKIDTLTKAIQESNKQKPN